MKMRIGAIVAFALIALSCSEDEPEIDLGPDAAGGSTADCDPIAQTGCETGQKCANRIESLDPFSSTADCVPDGTGAEGDACDLVGEPETGEGYDDCQAGLTCSQGACTPICDSTAAGGCSAVNGYCVAVDNFFAANIGLCADACHPVQQDCEFPDQETGDGEPGEGGDDGDDAPPGACYFHPTHSDGVCLSTSDSANERLQGDECLGTGGGPGFLNGCALGHGCWLPLSQSLWTCTFFCEPTGAFDGAPCGADGGPGADGFECRYLNGWLGYDIAEVPESVGVCLPTDLDGLTPCADDDSGPGCQYEFSGQAQPPAAARAR